MDLEVYGEIYCLTFPNGKYIGQTTQGFDVRWKEHLKHTKAGSTLPVHNAIRKYYNEDETNHKIKKRVIAIAYSLEELNMLEKKCIIEHNTFNDNGNNPTGYNLTAGGDGCKGYKFTDKQREECRQREYKKKYEHPEIAINHGIYMKQLHKDNPTIGINHGIQMKQLYMNEPNKKKEMSLLKIQQNKDNPEMARQQSELKKMFYEDKHAHECIEKLRNTSKLQWQDPEKKNKIMVEKRKRLSKPFNVFKDGILIDSFDYIPDCAAKLFGITNDSNLSAAVNGRRPHYKGYTFSYKIEIN
jgi:hypothetical protein